MAYIGTNQKIKEIRLERGLTLKEASHFLGLTKMRLRLYEGGYLKIRYKDREKFISKYELDGSFFEGDLEYPTFKKEEKVISTKTPILERTPVIVLAFIFLIISVAGFLSDNYVSNYAANNPSSFFSEVYVEIQDYANENYQEENHHYDMLYNDNYNEFYNEGYDEHNQAKMQIYEESRNLSYTTYFHRRLVNNNHNEMNYYYNGDGMDIMFYFADYTGTVYRDFIHENKYESIFGYNEQSQKIKLKESDPKFKECVAQVEEEILIAEQEFDSILNDPTTFNKDVTFKEIARHQIHGAVQYSLYLNGGFIVYLCSALVGLLSITIIFFKLFIVISKRSVDDFAIEDEGIEIKEDIIKVKPLKKDWHPGLSYIPETAIRIIGLSILAFISLTSIIYFGTFIYGFTFITSDQAKALHEFAKNLTVISVFILLFAKLDIMQSNENLAKKVLTFFIGGLFYYVAENLVVSYIASSPDIVGVLLSMFMGYLPGNIFWGISVFCVISLFLFITPKKASKSKARLVIWRLLCLIPIAYLVMSNLYSLGIKNWGWTSVPFYISSLLYQKSTITSLFAIIFIISIFIYRYILVKKYGKENALIYMKGKRYVFYKNLTVCIIVLVLASLDFVLGKYLWVDNPLGFGNSYLIALVIPFILLYQNHLGKRSKLTDYAYIITYFILYTSPYFILAIMIMAY